MKTNLEKEYVEDEFCRDIVPYRAYGRSLEDVFDFSIFDSMLDLGCNNGGLIEYAHRRYPHLRIKGMDYFPWAVQYADESIRGKIELADLSKRQEFPEPFDLVNCSEVGEHIEKEAEDVFLDNLYRATKDILVLTWSDEPSHGNDQHQNPLPKSHVIQKMTALGMFYWEEATASLVQALRGRLQGIGFHWWAETVMIFRKKRFCDHHSIYLMQGVHTDNSSHKENFIQPDLYHQDLQQSFMALAQYVRSRTVNRIATSILRVGDGDYFFLKKMAVGSATPGRRAITRNYDQIDIKLYKRLFWENDMTTVSLEKNDADHWKNYVVENWNEMGLWRFKPEAGACKRKLVNRIICRLELLACRYFGHAWFLKTMRALGNKLRFSGTTAAYHEKARLIFEKKYMPLECVYALVASRWIFRNFKNQIGLISGGPKLKIIQALIQREQYREWIGMDAFTDYIEIPQIGSADDVEALAAGIGPQIAKSDARIFLVAAGSAKIGLMPLLKRYSDAVLIDVGCGVDALAGYVCQDRPYFADWVNFRIKGYDYSGVDFMDKGNPAWDYPQYKTIWLD